MGETVNAKILGANIRNVREALGYSLPELAQKSGISKGYLWQVERGMNNVTIDCLEKIAGALGTESWRLIRLSTGAPIWKLRKVKP